MSPNTRKKRLGKDERNYKPVLEEAHVSLNGQWLESFQEELHESDVVTDGPQQLADGFDQIRKGVEPRWPPLGHVLVLHNHTAGHLSSIQRQKQSDQVLAVPSPSCRNFIIDDDGLSKLRFGVKPSSWPASPIAQTASPLKRGRIKLSYWEIQ